MATPGVAKFPQISPEKRKVSQQTTADVNNNNNGHNTDYSSDNVNPVSLKKINVDESANTVC